MPDVHDDVEPPTCADEPCLCAPELVVGVAATGTTCDVSHPPGSSCSETATAFYRFEVPPGSCVGPGGNTGPDGTGTALANTGTTPLVGVLEVGRTDVPCGEYAITLGK